VPGQVWSYKTRPGEESSTLTILRVEKTPKLGTIVHLRIDRVHFSNCTGGPSPEVIEHAPFTRAALEASVTMKVNSVTQVPAYDAGYKDWLSHCGGVYTITVDRMVAVDDATFNAGLGCHCPTPRNGFVDTWRVTLPLGRAQVYEKPTWRPIESKR
jgi:hypothetical protein